MIVTSISVQQKDKNRVNVSLDGKYRLSLDVFQISDLGIKVGATFSEEEIVALEEESQFGKTYARALEYCLMRPHSSREVRDYLYRKTRSTRTSAGRLKQGVSSVITERVFQRLEEKGYIDDQKFTRYWVENRSLSKGASKRKLIAELRAKGVNQSIIDLAFQESDRSDDDELQKVIARKRSKYADEQKFMAYLARLGFSYDDIKSALATED